MSRILRARLWLGAASVGAFVFVTSLAAMVRSCERAHGCPILSVPSFDTLRSQLAEIQRSRHAHSAPR